jgi:gamma-glutamyl hercynylcysteine S-oxide synthase
MEMSVRTANRAGLPGSRVAGSSDRSQIVAQLEDVRARTRSLLDRVDDERLHSHPNKLMSPLVWDAGHVGVYEELWLVMNVSGSAAINEPRMRYYDAFENPRATRGELPLMRREEVEKYRDAVRRRVYDILDEVDMQGDDPLTADGFVYAMVIQHESQHNETLLQALQLMPGGYDAERQSLPAGRRVTLDQVTVPAGRYPIGTDAHEPYDNEHPRHIVELSEFSIDRFPVTCGQYLMFIEDEGYQRRELWSPAGWEWRESEGATAPAYWRRQGTEWYRDSFGRSQHVEADHPVMHVSWYEADAYCHWVGRRLPTEFEWEVAAAWDPDTGGMRRYPWGDAPWRPDLANLDQRAFSTAPVGAYPAGASALGCEQMLGDVYEWTSSDFLGYPGFCSFPYPQYSEVFFGHDYKVLRGASWATRASVARTTFRNWDFPIRRQIFSGFRTAANGSTNGGSHS